MVSDIAAFDLLPQRLYRFADMLQVRINRKRAAIGFESVRVVTKLLQD
jgi:hypothetical protein